MPTDPIAHEVVVEAGTTGAFDAFAAHLGSWWPLAYTFSGAGFVDAGIEPTSGGIWFERNAAGEKLSWGKVRFYRPGELLVLGFGIGADRQPVSDGEASEVDVRFSAATPARTRVRLEHRDFARHGADGERLRAGLDSPQGWPLILAELRRWIHSRPAVRYIVANMDAAVAFYTGRLGFAVDLRPAPGFTALSRAGLLLYLNEPGAGGAGATTTDGRRPEPGGWNRLQLTFTNLESAIDTLRGDGCQFRSDLVEGNGGKQILLEDPSGNPIELFQPRS